MTSSESTGSTSAVSVTTQTLISLNEKNYKLHLVEVWKFQYITKMSLIHKCSVFYLHI